MSLGQGKLLQNMLLSVGVKYLPEFLTGKRIQFDKHVVKTGGSTAN